MGIFGWDFPPGCSINDLPGNSPEEQAAEAFADNTFDQIRRLLPTLPEEAIEKLVEWGWQQVSDAYANGYQQARADTALAENEAQQ